MVDWGGLDYTSTWSGVYALPDSGEPGSLYVLDDERTVGRNTPIYDECTRLLFDEAHPRTFPAGQRAPGPYGAGWASDRIGPDAADRRATALRARDADLAQLRRRYFDAREGSHVSAPPSPSAVRAMRWYGGGGESRPETFAGGPAAYAAGSRALGHPGPRGMVTSYRGARQAIDGVDWDDRPYRYAPESPNEWAHLFIPEAARGPPLYWALPSSYLGPLPQIPQVDRFSAGGGGFDPWVAVLFLVAVALVAWVAAGRRLPEPQPSAGSRGGGRPATA